MSECKHGLKSGCAYCHVTTTKPSSRPPVAKKRSRTSTMSEKMNDKMTALQRRLRQLRGDTGAGG
jgi:hypothetical protein